MSATDIAKSVDVDLDQIAAEATEIIEELIETANMKPGQIMVIGCSSSEIAAHTIGRYSSKEVGETVFNALNNVAKKHQIYLAAQCCEHLNRAIIIEREAAKKYGYEIVSVVPQPKAGGSFATTAYKNFENPVALENVKADAGLDIGLTLIGMHLKSVAVPVRLSLSKIGEANIVAARTRPKFIGGERAKYE